MSELPARVPVIDPNTIAGCARKPHVMIVGHRVGDQLYGAERSLLDLLAAVDRQRYDVSCVFPTSDDAYLRAARAHTGSITVFQYQWWSKERPFDQDCVARFESLFRCQRVDLVHVNTMTLVDPLLAAQHLGVPSIVHVRELIDQDEQLAGRFGDDASAIVQTIRAAADFIIANSEATYRLYHKQDRSFRLYNSVDVRRFDLPNNLEPGKLKIGIISDNRRKKGIEGFVDLAILASGRRPDLEFVVIGPRSSETDRIQQIVRDSGHAPNLRFVGYVADPVEAIRHVNVVVSLSIAAESFGRTIAEAMAARRPVIAYQRGAAPELIRHGTDGFLIPYLDFAKALDHLVTLADHPALLQEIGRNGRERAIELFSPAVFASQLNGIYRRIMDAWSARPRDRISQFPDLSPAAEDVSRAMRTLSSP